MYYHAKVFTSNVTGTRTMEVLCEKCGTDFFYELARVGKGSASAPYYIGQAWAKRRAEKYAKKNLAKRLDREVELVPCPACRWVNAEAIRIFRKTRHKALSAAIRLIALFAVALDALFYFEAKDLFGKAPDVRAPELWVTGAASLLMIAVCVVLQVTLRRRIEPNVLDGGNPLVPPGTPPALLRDSSGQGFVRVPSTPSESHGDFDWATVRPGQLVLDPLCCECLSPAITVFKLPMTRWKLFPVPMCEVCLRAVRMRFWKVHAGMLSVELAVGAIVWWLLRAEDDAVQIALGCLSAALVWLVVFLVLDTALRPYRMRTVDASRGLKKIWFRNPAYTALLIRRIGLADGLYEQPSP